MVRDGRVDMDGVNGWVLQQLLVARVALFDAPLVADFVQLLRVALADGEAPGGRVLLQDGNKFIAEAEANGGDVEGGGAHRSRGGLPTALRMRKQRLSRHFLLRTIFVASRS